MDVGGSLEETGELLHGRDDLPEEELPEEAISIDVLPKKKKKKRKSADDDEYKCGGAVARGRLEKSIPALSRGSRAEIPVGRATGHEQYAAHELEG